MPLLENLMEGVASAAGADTAVARIEKKKGERKALSDEERQSNLDLYNKAITNIQTHMGTLDPESSQYKTLQGALDKAVKARTQLFHPAQGTSPIGKLGELLHIKKPAVTAATPTEDPLTAALTAGTPITKEKWKNTGKPTFNKETGLWSQTQVDAEGNQRVTPMPEGWTPPPLTELYDRVPGVVDGQVTTLWRDKHNPKHWVDTSGNDVPPETLAKFTALPPRNALGSESTTVDPFGVSSTTVRRPILPGVQPTAPPAKGAVPKTPGEAKKEAAKTAPKSVAKATPKGVPQLDAQGHIPETAHVNRNLREAANQLLDGQDITKLPIPQKDKGAAADLARQYGWKGQGFLAPADKVRLKESMAILDQIGQLDLSLFDSSTDRAILSQVIQNAEKRGVTGQLLQQVAGANMSPATSKFLNFYLQAVGRITGLASLIRAGRPTEATIERLKGELPNPFNTFSSADAREKLDLLKQEIDIALDTGQFKDNGSAVSDDEFLKQF